MEPDTMIDPRALSHARRTRGMSRTTLATRIGVSTNTLRAWETGRHQPQGRSLRDLEIALGVKASELASPLPEEVPPPRISSRWESDRGTAVDFSPLAFETWLGIRQRSCYWLASATGISQTTLSFLRRGVQKPHFTTLVRIAQALDCPPEALLTPR